MNALKNKIFVFVLLGLLFATFTTESFAQGTGTVIRNAVIAMGKNFSNESAEMGTDLLTTNLGKLVGKYGDDAILGAQKVGPKIFRYVEEAGENGLQSVKAFAKYGDDAVWIVAKKDRLSIFVKYGDDAANAMLKHKGIAEPLLNSFGKTAASALNSLAGQNARRLAMMTEDGTLKSIGKTEELLGVIAKYGDKGMNFIWDHKGPLAVASVCTTFLMNPQPYIDGTLNLAKDVTLKLVQPLAEVPGKVAAEAAKNTNWTWLLSVIVSVIGVCFGFRMWLRQKKPA